MESRASGYHLFIVLFIAILSPGIASAWSWQDLWQTPHQQRRALEQQGNYQSLIDGESAQWQGVGHYRSGDYAAAVESYKQSDSVASRYNYATALTRAGDYDAAIEHFDELLSEDPTHEQAAHNLDLARQLKELQQQEQQQNQDQDQQNDQSQEQDDSEQQDQSQQQDQQDSESESSEQQDQSSDADQQDEAESDESQQQQDSQSQQEQENIEQENKEQEEQKQQAEQQPGEQEAAEASAVESEEPLSEDQQAIEQWLRKIPDDPSGLLRRKLIRSHRTDFPDIGDSQSPW